MNKNKIYTTMIGLVAFAFTLFLNFRNASNDYGILENTLSAQVLASNGSSSLIFLTLKDCPGGFCYYYYDSGKLKCNACCPYGKTPKCSFLECICNKD